MASIGKPDEKGFPERPMWTVREEKIERFGYRPFADARGELGQSLDDAYNRRWIHSSLGDLTPAEFEQPWPRGMKRSLGDERARKGTASGGSSRRRTSCPKM